MWAKLHSLVLDELGFRGELTGRGARSAPSASVPSNGATDRTESDRPRKEGIEDPPDRRPPGPALVDRQLCYEPPRQSGPHPAGPRHPPHSLPSWSPGPTARENGRRQGLRLLAPARLAVRPRQPAPHRPQGHRVIPTTGPAPLGRGTNRDVLAVRLPTIPPSPGAQARSLPRLHSHRHHPHMPPRNHQPK